MAYKQFALDGIGDVTIYKRRGSRSVRLSVDHSGRVKVSMPTWLPYRTGLSYAVSKQAWLTQQLAQHQTPSLASGQTIGKQHQLLFEPSNDSAIRTRLTKQSDIIVRYPAHQTPAGATVQQAAQRACIRALRQEAEALLLPRLRDLATTHDLEFRSFAVKQLKGRWGSCDQRGHIVMNLFIMQLPWELIDYVLLHELAHTQHLHHGPDFWRLLDDMVPGARATSKRLRTFRPIIGAIEPTS